MMQIYQLDTQLDWFPDPKLALKEPDGLLAIGGDLAPERILHAYQQGIFPWFNDGEPPLWWSPDPRALFAVAPIKRGRTLQRAIKRGRWHFSLNKSFSQVMQACAAPRKDQPESWITDEMCHAYEKLHQQGHAHSIEVWQDSQLIGGLYGIRIGAIFCGESMFHLKTEASKAAFAMLQNLCFYSGIKWIDGQIPNPYLLQLGFKPVPRKIFLQQLEKFRDHSIHQQRWQTGPLLFDD